MAKKNTQTAPLAAAVAAVPDAIPPATTDTPPAAKNVDHGPSADKLAKDIALKAKKFGGVAALIGHYEFKPSRRVAKKAAADLLANESTEHAAALEAWIIETYGAAAPAGSNLNNLRGRPMPVIGESRGFSVQRIDTDDEEEVDGVDKDGKPTKVWQPKLDEAGNKIKIPGSTFIRLNLSPLDVLKGGEVTAEYVDANTVKLTVTRRARRAAPDVAPADAPVDAAA